MLELAGFTDVSDVTKDRILSFGLEKTLLAPCCFFLALSHIAGLIETGFPFLCIHLLEQTKTPKHDFFRIFTLWLLVFLIAHPEVCFFASSQLGE